jgi:hypothetical protein
MTRGKGEGGDLGGIFRTREQKRKTLAVSRVTAPRVTHSSGRCCCGLGPAYPPGQKPVPVRACGQRLPLTRWPGVGRRASSLSRGLLLDQQTLGTG